MDKLGILIVVFLPLVHINAVTLSFKKYCRHPATSIVLYCYNIYKCDGADWRVCQPPDDADPACFPIDEYIQLLKNHNTTNCNGHGSSVTNRNTSAVVNTVRVIDPTNETFTEVPNHTVTNHKSVESHGTTSPNTVSSAINQSNKHKTTPQETVIQNNTTSSRTQVISYTTETVELGNTSKVPTIHDATTDSKTPPPTNGTKVREEMTTNTVSTQTVRQEKAPSSSLLTKETMLAGTALVGMVIGSLITIAVCTFSSKVQRYMLRKHKCDHSPPHQDDNDTRIPSTLDKHNIYTEINMDFVTSFAMKRRNTSKISNATTPDTDTYECLRESTFVKDDDIDFDEYECVNDEERVYLVLENIERTGGLLTLRRQTDHLGDVEEPVTEEHDYFVLKKVNPKPQNRNTSHLDEHLKDKRDRQRLSEFTEAS